MRKPITILQTEKKSG